MSDSPLFKADRVTVTLSRGSEGKMDVLCTSLLEGRAVVFPGGKFELRLGAQGVEGRVIGGVPPPSDAQSLADAGYG